MSLFLDNMRCTFAIGKVFLWINIVQLFQISTLEVCADFVAADAFHVEKPIFWGKHFTSIIIWAQFYEIKTCIIWRNFLIDTKTPLVVKDKTSSTSAVSKPNFIRESESCLTPFGSQFKSNFKTIFFLIENNHFPERHLIWARFPSCTSINWDPGEILLAGFWIRSWFIQRFPVSGQRWLLSL